MRTRVWLLAACVLLALCAGPAGAQTADMKALLSRLESMGHGYHSDAEWAEVFSQMDAMVEKAEAAGNWSGAVDVEVLRAQTFSDMLGEPKRARAILREVRKKYGEYGVSGLRKTYVREAEVLAKLGDDAGIAELIGEFKRSPYYDPQNYSYSGGQGRNDPLVLQRPGARGDDSLSVSAMEMYRQQARFAAGREFPSFEGEGLEGGAVRLEDYRGKVVLVDLWLMGWTPWKRELPNLLQLHQRYGPQGFEILGVNMDRNPAALREFVRANGMKWPQIADDLAITKKLGVYGEATSFLLDRSGNIIGRDLKGAMLNDAVKRALGAN